jgi:hypothetical protein
MQPPPQYQQQIQQPVHMNWFKRHLNWTYFLGLFGIYLVFGFIVLILYILYDVISLSAIDETTTGTVFLIVGIVWFVCVCCLKYWVIAQKGRSWAWNLMPVLWLWIPLLLGNKKGK